MLMAGHVPPAVASFASRARRRVPRWPARLRPRGRDVVVLYHRVAMLHRADPLGMVVEPPLFQQQLEALSDAYEIVPAGWLVTAPRQSHGRPRAALTFDDGYADNAELVAPLLETLGLPATYFLTTDPLLTDPVAPVPEYWWDRLDHLIRDDIPLQRLSVSIGNDQVDLELGSESEKLSALKLLNRQFMRRHPAVVSSALAQLESAADSPAATCDEHRRMTSDHAVMLSSRSGVELGSHTCTHAALGRLSAGESRSELQVSRGRLAELLGRPPRLVAYPYGAAGTLGRRDARAAADIGYEQGFVNVPGPVEGASPYAVPRFTVGREEPEALLARLRAWDRPRRRS
jgi:peptidoglycan/xylan/chitin deacetylase (PgdA/CDA1 family)